ncbi:MAG: phosphatidylserine decarboxylase family protein [Gemmatimonadetes bacterium]|nr:phosphatidylserine decarboxylase family protein [Gemmatimonadota bacterium]
MRIAPEGWPFIIGFWALEAVLYAFAPWWAAALWLPVCLWVIAFFRDPVREGPRGDNLVIAPADGLVVSVVMVDEPDYLKARVQRVSIFMNVFNVHVNRYPMSGTLEYRHYNKGSFGHAGTEKASLENEQSSVGMLTARGKVLVRQIAGLVARRIVTDHQPGTAVLQAERMGLIRFGSRVDVFLPDTARVLVHTGDKTVAGQTVVAQWE